MRRGEIGRRVRSVLEQLGLGERERALPTQLSDGEQQRIGIARAVVSETRLLVADEPTGNLDTTLSAAIMALFASLPEHGTDRKSTRPNTSHSCALSIPHSHFKK